MNVLAIDSSTEFASVALSIKGELRYKEHDAKRQHAHLLLPMIESLLAEAGLGFSQLDTLVYGRGPGSFTGLRIACSVAKGLAYAHDLPLIPVSSLAAIAEQALKQFNEVCVLSVIDARMNQLYWAQFIDPSQEIEERVADANEILIQSERPIILAGVGYEPYLQLLSPAIKAKISHYLTIYPKADAMIRLALSGKIKAVSAAEALPIYVRNQITQGEPRG